MDYDSLIASKGTPGSIANWVNFSDALLPLADILGDAQALIYDSLRVSYMRDIVDLTLPAGESVVAQPASTLQIIGIWDDQNSKLWAKDEVSLQNMRTVDEQAATWQASRPQAYSEFGGSIQFDTTADAEYKFKMMGFFIPAPLSETNKTNFLTTRWPQMLRTACLAIAADFLNDDAKYARFLQRLSPLVGQANASGERMLAGMVVDVDYSRSRP